MLWLVLFMLCEYVVICVGCDGGNIGEVLVIFGGVAGWGGDGCVVIFGCVSGVDVVVVVVDVVVVVV